MEIKQHILNNSMAKEITREARRYFELNDNEIITYQILWYFKQRSA